MSSKKVTVLKALMRYKAIHYLLDIVISALALFVTECIFVQAGILHRAWDNFELIFVPAVTVMMLVFFTINDLYDIADRRLDERLARVIAALLKSLAVAIVMIQLGDWEVADRMLLTYSLLASLLFLGAFFLRWYVYARWYHKELNTVLIAQETEARWVLTRFSTRTLISYRLIRWTPRPRNLEELLSGDVQAVLLGTGFERDWTDELICWCLERDIALVYIPSSYSIINNGSGMRTIDDIMVFVMAKFRLDPIQKAVKRALDIIFATSALLLLSPVIALTALVVRLGSPGEVIYKQKRVGLNGREFMVCKFRSMCANAEKATGAIFSSANDVRLTTVGKFLRATRLDEIPQFFNVLRGDMSIVGPRPERLVFTTGFERQLPLYKYRHNVKPGITGMAQLYGKYNTAVEFKILYDLYYINRCQRRGVLLTDLSIMLQTLSIFFNRNSAEGFIDLDLIRMPEIDAAHVETSLSK